MFNGTIGMGIFAVLGGHAAASTRRSGRSRRRGTVNRSSVDFRLFILPLPLAIGILPLLSLSLFPQ